MMTWKMLQTMMTMLPLLLLPLMTGLASGQGSPAGTEFNLTTIEPDDETINTLIEAVDSAVTSLQSAAGTTTDSSFPSFDYGSWEVSWD